MAGGVRGIAPVVLGYTPNAPRGAPPGAVVEGLEAAPGGPPSEGGRGEPRPPFLMGRILEVATPPTAGHPGVPAPVLLIERLRHAARAAAAATVFVPLSVPAEGFVPMATVTLEVLDVTTLSNASSN